MIPDGASATHELAAPASGTPRLVLRFWEFDGQLAPALVLESSPGPTVLLHSVQSPAPSPASPPLQQLHSECREQSNLLLGVGQAGRNHWSASCEAQIDQPRIEMQIACRVNEAGDWLGSTWQTGQSLAGDPADDPEGTRSDQIIWPLGDQEFRILASPGTTIAGPDSKGHIRVEPAESIPDPLPATLQWRYAFQLS